MFFNSLSHITAEALVPEHLIHYVKAVSGRECILCSDLPVYIHGQDALIVAHAPKVLRDFLKEPAFLEKDTLFLPEKAVLEGRELLSSAILDVQKKLGPKTSITILAPFLPKEPVDPASIIEDAYWQVPFPLSSPRGKLKNMLLRANFEVFTQMEAWNEECTNLVQHYLRTKPLSPGTRHIFSNLEAYANSGGASNVRLVAARKKDTGKLSAFSIGDFSGLHTGFYMFAFRYPDAPPGTADLLLQALLLHGEKIGHSRMNLGLGISPGISFFKKKWGAVPFLPHMESRLIMEKSAKKGFLGRFFQSLGQGA